jgi:hydroxycarboxylate dehydrogenase B
VLAGALTGGGSGHPDNPSADRPINNLLSILIDPERMAGAEALAADLKRLLAYVTASPPATPGGQVLLPGEIERRTRAERLAHGIPLDPNTLDQLRGAARAVDLSDATIERGIIPTETTRQS